MPLESPPTRQDPSSLEQTEQKNIFGASRGAPEALAAWLCEHFRARTLPRNLDRLQSFAEVSAGGAPRSATLR